jgi:hypothetical protein
MQGSTRTGWPARAGSISDQNNPFVPRFHLEPWALRPGRAANKNNKPVSRRRTKHDPFKGKPHGFPFCFSTVCHFGVRAPGCRQGRPRSRLRGPWATEQSCRRHRLAREVGGAVPLRRISRTRGRAWKKPRGRFPPYGAVRDPAAIGMATLTSSARGATGADGGKGSRSASRRRSVGWATVQPCPPQALPAKPSPRSPT